MANKGAPKIVAPKGAGKTSAAPEEEVLEKRIADQWRKFLPDLLQWPVFWTEKEQVVTLKEI